VRITLAYTYDGHDADATIEVDDQVGRQMVHDGAARLPDQADLADQSAAELRAYALDHGIDLAGARSKVDIAETIRAAEEAAIPPQSPITPLPGAQPEGES